MLTVLHRIAERKIEQAIRENRFDDLSHWKGKRLPEEDMSHVPPDLRMAYKMLKNSGYVPEEVTLRREIQETRDLLARASDEQEKYNQLKRLRFLEIKLEERRGRGLGIERDSPYFARIVNKVG